MNNMIKSESSGFTLAPSNLQEAMELAEMICKTDIVPKDFQGKAGNTLVAIMLGNEVGLNPLQSLTNIAVINGRPSIWGDSMLAICQMNPKFVSITETYNSETETAVCTVVRRGDEPHTTTFSKEDAVRAGLWQTEATVTRTNYQTKKEYTKANDSPWYKYPKRMLQMRARGFALRDKFSDSLKGLISREEAQDYPTDITSQVTVITDDDVPAKVVEPELVLLPEMDNERFNINLKQYTQLIKSKKKTHDEIIYTLKGKYALTNEQIQIIQAVKI